MKGKNLREVQDEYQKAVVGTCLVCEKAVRAGFYGSWANGGTCSKKCEQEQAKKPKFPGYTEEDFFNRMNARSSP